MVEGRFGTDFAASVFELEPGGWSVPTASTYGYHLVFVTGRAAARVPDFPDVAARVATDLEVSRRTGALDHVYASVRDGYDVEIEPADEGTTSQPEAARAPVG